MTQRTEMIKRELKAHKESNEEASYAIPLRGNKEYLPVIRVNAEDLILNPNNNRLSGQLKDHPKRKQVVADPNSTESQALLRTLLSQTAKFGDLQKQLKVMGQQEPGLITRDGLLVNGNTRVTALLMLNEKHVDVAVLPENINESDVLDMEMSLQVTDLVHQDYTFTNELLLMKRFLDAGNTHDALAKKMAWIKLGVKKVKTHMRLLSYIEEVRRLSPIPYSVFDSKKQHLKDLDNDYIRLIEQGEVEKAESLKWTRLTMTFLGLNKDQVRAIDPDFVDENLIPRLDGDNKGVREHLEEYRINEDDSDDGLDDLLDESISNSINMKSVLEDLLSNKDQRSEDGDVNIDLSGLYGKLSFNARRATENIIDEQKLESANAEPSEALKEAKVKITSIRQKLPHIIRDPKFKIEKFLYDLDELMNELTKLHSDVKKTDE